MKTPLAAGIVIIVLALGGWYYLSMASQEPAPVAAGGPTTAADTYGSPDQGNTVKPDTGVPQQPASAPKANATIVTQNLVLGLNTDANLGTHLSSINGMTVYTFDKDTKGVSNCSGACAANWPPYTVASAADVQVPAGITGAVSTMARVGGALQVTYNGKPLYHYVGDVKPGDTKGEGVNGTWHIAKP